MVKFAEEVEVQLITLIGEKHYPYKNKKKEKKSKDCKNCKKDMYTCSCVYKIKNFDEWVKYLNVTINYIKFAYHEKDEDMLQRKLIRIKKIRNALIEYYDIYEESLYFHKYTRQHRSDYLPNIPKILKLSKCYHNELKQNKEILNEELKSEIKSKFKETILEIVYAITKIREICKL